MSGRKKPSWDIKRKKKKAGGGKEERGGQLGFRGLLTDPSDGAVGPNQRLAAYLASHCVFSLIDVLFNSSDRFAQEAQRLVLPAAARSACSVQSGSAKKQKATERK